MSQANLELFYDKVIQHPALLNALTSGVTTPDEFIARVVMMGNAQGYTFTHEEADAWIAAHAAANDSGELSDMQLEAIAGGKQGLELLDQITRKLRPTP